MFLLAAGCSVSDLSGLWTLTTSKQAEEEKQRASLSVCGREGDGGRGLGKGDFSKIQIHVKERTEREEVANVCRVPATVHVPFYLFLTVLT